MHGIDKGAAHALYNGNVCAGMPHLYELPLVGFEGHSTSGFHERKAQNANGYDSSRSFREGKNRSSSWRNQLQRASARESPELDAQQQYGRDVTKNPHMPLHFPDTLQVAFGLLVLAKVLAGAQAACGDELQAGAWPKSRPPRSSSLRFS